MNLMDKYIAEVGKHLPRKNRADIEAEIRSTLEDMLDERKQAPGPADDATIMVLLKEYGSPREVAESYVGPRYLIGPRVYPIFELVTKIVMAVLLAVSLAGLGISLSKSSLAGPEFLSTIGESALGLLGGMITAFGNIVLVFTILERVLPAKEFDEEEEWNPAELASEPDPDRVKFGEQIFEMFFLVLFLILFNLYPGAIGIGFFTDGEWTFISPILTDAFFSYLPWINTLFLLQLGFNVYLLRQGVWNTTSRIMNIILEIGSIALAVMMLRGPSLVALTAEQLAGTPLEGSARVFTTIGNLIPSLVLTIVIIVSSIEVAQMVYRLLKSRPSTPYPVIK
ncbi:MAG: HAAS signaling domain-containing protein [Anaerolineales bacterium]